MASTKKEITHTFSRLDNNLAELQRWFPAYIKNDGVGGLSVDPVLFRTTFGPETPSNSGGYDDEASVAGIRVEAIQDDGTAVSNNPTITISGAGTLDAKCTINHDDGSGSTIIRLIAPSADGKATSGTWHRAARAAGNIRNGETAGPFPVMMTLQELAEMIDTYRHIGDGDENKKSWLPHGIRGGGQSGGISTVSALPSLAGGDLRETSSVAFPTTSPYRATIFMPMLLDNNQFDSRITSANNDISQHYDPSAGTGGYEDGVISGYTRYDSNPDGDDSSTIRYKTVGYSGDHLKGHRFAGQGLTTNAAGTARFTETHGNDDISPDSSAIGAPSYRMRMALAMFLKNGTYTLKGGTIIPYTYDTDREIGGSTTSTLHAVWDGLDGLGTHDLTGSNLDKLTSAQIYPLFDFLQGPMTIGAIGINFDYSVVEGEHTIWQATKSTWEFFYPTNPLAINVGMPKQFLLRPNPKPVPIEAFKRDGNTKIMEIWLNYDNAGSPVFTPQTPIYIHSLTGVAGSGASNSGSHGAFRPAADGNFEAFDYDCNGWWIINDYETDSAYVRDDIFGDGDTSTFNGAKISIKVNTNEIGTLATFAVYKPSSGYVCQGRIGGYEDGRTDDIYNIQPLGQGDTDGSAAVPAGTGYRAGIDTPATSVFSQSNNQDTYPARIVMGRTDVADADGIFQSGVLQAPRSIGLFSADDNEFVHNPSFVSKGGGGVRIPAGMDFDYAMRYYALSVSGTATSWTNSDDEPSSPTSLQDGKGLRSRWFSKGLYTPLWSYIDSNTGNHGWDKTLPVGASGTWLYGRNRPFPPHYRCGTRLAYTPSLEKNAEIGGGWNSAAPVGNRVRAGQPTTKIGLTEIGTSPIWLDFELTAFIPSRSNRMTRIEFDTGENHPEFGKYGMLFNTLKQKNGAGYLPFWDESGIQHRTSDSNIYLTDQTFTAGRSVIWLWKDADWFASGWDETREWAFSNVSQNAGFGSLGNGYGTGGSFAHSEGMHTIRACFTDAGMEVLYDGVSKGVDSQSAKAVYGVSIECANAGAGGDGSTTTDPNGYALEQDAITLQKTQADIQIDELVLRQIPTPAMLPFTVDTVKQYVSGIAKYASLTVEAENIATSRGMNIKATLLTPSTTTPESEGLVPISGFENVDLAFIGGIGSMSLDGLPASAISNGFVIRWLFYIPSKEDTANHPIDWNSIPVIRSWTLEYDLAPTASLAVVGNTFNNDITGSIATRVGHIISFRGTGTTTDDDRKISALKFDFGDGSSTDWLSFTDQTLQSNTYDVSHSYLATGTYDAVVYAKDDNGNESVASTAVEIVVANAPPVAVLRAVPSMVRAGQSLTLDGSASYDINAGGTLSTYTFTFGDGSSSVSGSSSSVSHTYANGGEYQATLVVQDSDGSNSQTASAVIKVLPATLVVPLTLNTKPRAFTRTKSANLTQTTVLDSIYPEITDMGQRTDEFVLTGSFLKATANADIEFMEELHLSGALVEIIWEEVNFIGTPTGKTFVGRMTSFDYQREGGRHGETPYNATFVREAGLGA